MEQFSLEKQRLMLSYMLSDPGLFTKVSPILETAYFDPQVRQAAGFLQKYYTEHKGIPNVDQIYAETSVRIDQKPGLTKDEVSYAESELEKFCRNNAIKHALMESVKLLEREDFGTIEKMIKEAVTVSLNKNIGLDYFDDVAARLNRMLQNSAPISTGWIELDKCLNGGVNRKEMLIFAAGSGVGKSITMMNLTNNLLGQKYNGVYISLELSEEVVSKRADSMMTGIGQVDIFKNIDKVAAKVERMGKSCGRFFVKRMPESTTNAHHIRAYLKELETIEGIIPDFLIIDYLDLMAPTQKISAENLFIKDKYVAEELRAIANDYNLLIVTASQLNRGSNSADAADVDHKNIAGGVSKINTADNVIAVLQTESMRAKGEYMFKLLKTRSSAGVGAYIAMRWDPISLRILNFEEGDQRKADLMTRATTLDETATKEEIQEAAKPQGKKLNLRDIMKQHQ